MNQITNSPLYQTWKVLQKGMHVQSLLARVAAENFVNAESVGRNPDESPYTRKEVIVNAIQHHGVASPEITAIKDDPTPPRMVYKPGHPAADKNGEVKFPAVNTHLEATDFQQSMITSSGCAHLFKTASVMVERTHNLMKQA